MQTCPNCSYRNRPGVVFCENCGASLIGEGSPLGTRNLGAKADPAPSSGLPLSGSDTFTKNTVLRIEIDGAAPLYVKPKQEMIFGRRDPATGALPDVDMTPFAGYRMGVSRRHASIRQTDENKLELWDLGSSNGTFLNGMRLSAHRPNRLHDGDEIRLGQMVMKIYFQSVDDTDTSLRKARAETQKHVSQSDNNMDGTKALDPNTLSPDGKKTINTDAQSSKNNA